VVVNIKRLTSTHIDFIINNWDKMTGDELAKECGCTRSTIVVWARDIRKKTNGQSCPAKKKGRKKK
jgi:transposase